MKAPVHLLLVAGARPNFMKIAPVIHTLRTQPAPFTEEAMSYSLVHTGQHYDDAMSDRFFAELDIPPPDISLDVGSATHAEQTARIMSRFEAACDREQPRWVVVFGDVNSTMACALVAAKKGIRIAHVEAGLRSFDRSMPEEINRRVTDVLADLLLTPSPDADENLKREGVEAHKIVRVGNIMIDSLVRNLKRARGNGTRARFNLRNGEFVYVTLHRPGNVDNRDSLALIMRDLERLSTRVPVLFPLHPRTRKMLDTFSIRPSARTRLRLVDPVGYHESLWLSEHARLVITDSGGLQEETTFFRTPCLTLRPNTERPITIVQGSNRLTRPAHLMGDIEDILSRPRRFGEVPELWDGRTAGRIVAAIRAATEPGVFGMQTQAPEQHVA